MTKETDVQKRIAKILDDAARAGGSPYTITTCKAAIDRLLEEGAISADYRNTLLTRVGNLLVTWTPEAVRNYCANIEFEAASGLLTPADLAELGLLLLQLVGQNLLTAEEAIALQAKVAASVIVEVKPAAPIFARTGARATP